MIIGAGQQFPRNNSHCVFQLQNGSGTTFTDTAAGKTGSKTGTAYGNVAWSTSSPPSGWTSYMAFDGYGDYVSFADHNDFGFGELPFTIESYFKCTGGTSAYIFEKDNTDSAKTMSLNIYSGNLYFTHGSTYSSTAITNNVYHHAAICREGTGSNKTYLFLDGVKKATLTCAEQIGTGTGVLQVGRYGTAAYYFMGEIAYLRFHKGIALWTRDFTPPNRAA